MHYPIGQALWLPVDLTNVPRLRRVLASLVRARIAAAWLPQCIVLFVGSHTAAIRFFMCSFFVGDLSKKSLLCLPWTMQKQYHGFVLYPWDARRFGLWVHSLIPVFGACICRFLRASKASSVCSFSVCGDISFADELICCHFHAILSLLLLVVLKKWGHYARLQSGFRWLLICKNVLLLLAHHAEFIYQNTPAPLSRV